MAAEREIKVNQVGYASCFLKKLDKLRKDGKHCDFIIKVGNKKIPVHRNALVINSEFFRGMLDHDTKENREGCVDMKDVEFTPIKKAIDFIYSGKASVATEDIGSLIHVAYMLQIPELCEGIGDLLADDLSLESFYETKKIADTYNCKGLGNTCDKFAFGNFEAIVAQEEFGQLDEDYVWLVINSSETNAAEIIKYIAFTKWIDCDRNNRRQSYTKLLKALDIVSIPASHRRYIIENEALAYESSECLKIFLSSFFATADIVAENFGTDWIGRIAGIDSGTNSIASYSPFTQTWKKVHDTDPDVSSSSYSIVLMDGYIYALRADLKVFKLRYFSANRAWQEVASMKQAHGGYPKAAILDGCIYVIGNVDGSTSPSEQYEPRSDSWADISSPAMCYPCRNFSVASCSDYLFCIGGWNGQSMQGQHYHYGGYQQPTGRVYNLCEKFDRSTSTWSAITPMNTARYSAGATGMAGSLYVVGGISGQSWSTVCELYDVANNSWTTIAYMPAAISPTGALIMTGKLYVVGGAMLLKYDKEKNEWITLQNTENKTLTAAGCIALDY